MVTFLLSTNIPEDNTSETKNGQSADNQLIENKQISEALTYTKNLMNAVPTIVTTSSSAQTEQPEEPVTEEMSKEEKALQEITQWKNEFPKIEEDSGQAEFINTIAPAAVHIAHENGLYPSVMIAQAGLESGWGSSDLAQTYNNLMGTKGSWNGNSITVQTREDINGESVYIDAGFSVYDSWDDSLQRYGQLMKNGLNRDAEYYSGTWRQNAANYQEATAWLEGRYATDVSYAEKLNRTIESFDLVQFDNTDPLDENAEEFIEQLNTEL